MQKETLSLYVLLTVLVVVLVWEMLWPRRVEKSGLAQRWGNNLALTLIGQAISNGASGLSLLITAWFAQHYQLGLLSHFQDDVLFSIFVTILIFEAMAYAIHVLFHRVPWLWRVHAVHHSDTELDFSSTYRHHPFEILLVYVITLPVIILVSPPLIAVLAYQAIRICFHFLTHSNIYIPESIDRWLRYIVVTPDFHRLHHCSDRQYTDSNYSTVLPWYDYLFGTASNRSFAEQETMEIGLEYGRDAGDSRIDRLLLMPFRPSSWFKTNTVKSPQPLLSESDINSA